MDLTAENTRRPVRHEDEDEEDQEEEYGDDQEDEEEDEDAPMPRTTASVLASLAANEFEFLSRQRLSARSVRHSVSLHSFQCCSDCVSVQQSVG